MPNTNYAYRILSQQQDDGNTERGLFRSKRCSLSATSSPSPSSHDRYTPMRTDDNAERISDSERTDAPSENTGDEAAEGLAQLGVYARTAEELERAWDAHIGVKRVEAAEKVYSRYSKWMLFISLGLASYIYSLDGSTTSNYLSFAASTFGKHSLIASVQVAQSVIIAVGKPVIAKVSDVTSRAYAYFGVLIFYVVGYITIASAQSINAIAAGIVVYAVGYTGLQILTQIIIADLTTLKWRGLVSSLTSLPFVVNGFIGPNIANAVLKHASWRWGYGMFAVLVPATLLPLILTLFWGERKARQIGLVDESPSGVDDGAKTSNAFFIRARLVAGQLDLLGLVLLGTAIALILVPLTLASSAHSGWHNPSIIAMLVIGCCILVSFAVWDLRYAACPVIAPRFVRNRSVLIACAIGFFDFMSFYLTFVYLYSFVLVVKPWSVLSATYFMQTQTISLTVFAVTAGAVMWWTRRYKVVLIVGLLVRLLGVALMIHSRGVNGSDVEIVWTQILQGLGGGMASASWQVGAQASVPHVDVAIVTAVVLLVTEIGGAVGSAIAGAIWSNTMPRKLAETLPQLSREERARLFGSITDVLQYPRGDPIREGVISAYDSVMVIMIIVATAVSGIPLLLAFGMPDWYLGDTQNAVDVTALDGRVLDNHEPSIDDDCPAHE